MFDTIADWSIPVFPLKSQMLLDNGCPRNKPLGVAMSRMKEIWVEHQFKLGAEELMTFLPDLLKEITSVDSKKPKLK